MSAASPSGAGGHESTEDANREQCDRCLERASAEVRAAAAADSGAGAVERLAHALRWAEKALRLCPTFPDARALRESVGVAAADTEAEAVSVRVAAGLAELDGERLGVDVRVEGGEALGLLDAEALRVTTADTLDVCVALALPEADRADV